MSRLSALLFLASFLSHPHVVLAQAETHARDYPSCPEQMRGDPAEAFDAGYLLLQNAQAAHGAEQAQLAERALAEFERQCSMGDDEALVERGRALQYLHDRMAVAQSLDAYLAAHPLDSLDGRIRHSVDPQLERHLVHVAWTGPAARLFVDGIDFGPLPRSMPLRLPPVLHQLEARDADGAVLGAIEISAAEPEQTAMLGPSGPVRVVEPPPPVDVADVDSVQATIPDPVQTPTTTSGLVVRDRPPESPLMIPAIATGIAAGVVLITAAILTGVSEERVHTYNAACAMPPPVNSCAQVLDEYHGVLYGEITSWVLGGAAAIASGVLFGLALSQPAPRSTAVICGPLGMGLGCDGRF